MSEKVSLFVRGCWLLTAFIFGAAAGLGTFEKWVEVRTTKMVVYYRTPLCIVTGGRDEGADGMLYTGAGVVWVGSDGIIYVNSWTRAR